LDYAGKQLYLHNRRNPDETTKVTIFIAALTYSDYFYAEGMTECDIRNWIRVNNAFCGTQRTPMRFRADAVRSITDALKRLL
ncbi:hypothetical protein H6B11_17725, partial [Mediterraneibacter glycyrrhizinilyticus]|nr:hypothetical protein [Mediterraneibacter glycyrrhizinilyticus]